MTAAIVPEFLLCLLEKEIANVSLDIAKFICDDYDLPYDDVCKKISKHICIELDVDQQNTYKLTKMTVRRNKISADKQCKANMFHKDHKCVTQCTLPYIDASKFCKKHKRMEREGRLRFGTVTQPLP